MMTRPVSKIFSKNSGSTTSTVDVKEVVCFEGHCVLWLDPSEIDTQDKRFSRGMCALKFKAIINDVKE
jgi:hypothetical protein